LAILARINHQLASGIVGLCKRRKGGSVAISNFLDESLVTYLEVDDRNAAIREMVNILDRSGKLHDAMLFQRAILEREKIVSTGIGMGVAIPHAKLDGYDDFFIAVGISKKGIDWNALDHEPVHLIFMIGGPEKEQTRYLHILSNLTSAIKDSERRKKILKASTPKQVIDLFEGR
jgi:PTS system nitrogen regulatory IIA component